MMIRAEQLSEALRMLPPISCEGHQAVVVLPKYRNPSVTAALGNHAVRAEPVERLIFRKESFGRDGKTWKEWCLVAHERAP